MSKPLTLNDRVRRSAAALSAEIDGEAVALHVANGVCYGMDPIAARVWSLIETPAEIGAMRDALVKLYDVDDSVCARDLVELLEDLRTADLITVETEPPRRDR